ncbi:FAD-dependent oxidoreductase [Amycolatopsis endophytica]|uniref:ferredoxin--NADP(+) reductase n=1 Tax=Amycolatopsis endophytica TaxID=860233 RepID=A0A853B7W8_9PSEU|nr:FAD-dependent oxidoreductase [Amycolatopsis endophytica]NYI90844.1 ferredoxin--NADP+ reductase [Amycolatopsis endophytica]
MAYAITQTCCNDASCVSVCPVNCIHPTPDEPDFGTTEMLYIDPGTCIDCGACADACPVDAIFPVDALAASMQPYAGINADHYLGREPAAADPAPNFHAWGPPLFTRTIPSDFPALDVAVVGSGPAGMYAVEDLLLHTSSRVTLIDRLETAGGLVRYGVAPDHPSTKKIGETFARYHHHPRLRMRLGTEVGRDVAVDELARRYDAVIYAVGASSAKRLGIPGEDLDGSVAATTVVAWYNGHPDVPADAVDLSSERIVVVGTGNVALDVARILTTDPASLEGTSISPAALERLKASRVREVVVLGRRGPESAAYTTPELLALTRHEDIDLVVDAHDPRVIEAIDAGGKAALLRDLKQESIDWTAPVPPGKRRIVLRFHSAPLEVLGSDAVRALRVAGDVEIPAGNVVRAVGYRGVPVPGLPFDEDTGTIPNDGGRVTPGTYVVGWIKRGPSGGIGANRACAQETVGRLLDDAVAGKLRVSGRRKGLAARLARRS